MTENNLQIRPYPLGAHFEYPYIRFSFVSKKENCGIILYDKMTGKRVSKLPFLPEERIGNIYCKYVEDLDASKIAYQFYQEDRILADSYARVFVGGKTYGKQREEKDLKAAFLTAAFDWEQDRCPRIPYENALCYCMHVRGFTRHASSGVSHRGTFLGIVEKLPYLKELGVTTVELQPAYEFTELPTSEERKESVTGSYMEEPGKDTESKLNYWGYKKGYYYAPKAAYAAGEDASIEFKQMVKAFHQQGMEVVMQFYFPATFSDREIPEILRYWVLEYHVDGFHLMGERLPISMIATDDALVHTKLWYYEFDTNEIYQKEEQPAYTNLAFYQDDYLYTMRRFLKGDENMLGAVLQQLRRIPSKAGRIHYMSNYYGMTLMDMVSYDRKHNEDNGEENRDGSDYNCSWNCGEEGATRKKKIKQLRLKQIKNAMCMLLFTQSTPLIFMGDEFGNSQKGNNNPYCQDNAVTYLDWRDKDRNGELLDFWKLLVSIRAAHPILHPDKEFRIMDYISCGYPDLSYHGQKAWRPGMEGYERHIGIMYCGKYARINHIREDAFFYVAMNMHWEPHELAMPRLPKGMEWKLLCATEEDIRVDANDSDSVEIAALAEKVAIKAIAPRSIAIYISVEEEAAVAGKEKKRGKRRI